MSIYEDMIQAVTVKHSDLIKGICTPLCDSLKLSKFWYYKIQDDGSYFGFGNDASWNEYYASERLFLKNPFMRHPKFLKERIKFESVKFTEVEDEGLKTIWRDRSKFDYGLSLSLIYKTRDGIEEFGFGSPALGERQMVYFLSILPLLRLFIKKFKVENAFLFSKLKDAQINIGKIIGSSFYKNTVSLVLPEETKRDFLQKMEIKIPDPLSSRELDIITLLLEGYLAPQIASQIFLSKRTVEHYIERIKLKLDCSSKTELIQKARELNLLENLHY